MEIEDYVYDLILGKLNDVLTPEEEADLVRWLAKTPEHELVFQEIEKFQKQVKGVRQDFHPDIENLLERLKRENRRKREVLPAWCRYAALFLLPLGIAFCLWNGMNREGKVEESRQFADVAHPGYEKAFLKLADGQLVVLDGITKDSLITEGNGVRVKTDSNRWLQYLIDSSVSLQGLQQHELIVPRGGEYQLVLSDGTKVWLNASSRLSFPQSFLEKERRVKLSGEAFFEVARDVHRPFIVETSKMDVKVLGTRFNINAYEENREVYTTLVSGSVDIFSNKNLPLRLMPGEQAYSQSGRVEKKEVEAHLYTSWVDGKFIFRDTDLAEIAKQISRWYDVDIFFANERVKKIRFTGAIVKFKPMEELIGMIESTSSVRFSVKKGTIVISE